MSEMKDLEILQDWQQEMDLLQRSIEGLAGDSTLQILEAGCGNRWPIRLEGVDCTLTGVDLDAEALEVRHRQLGDLDSIFVGDLRTVDLERERYDVIYNSFVLEHVKGAEQVLENFCRWLKPGGLILLRVPERNSVYGFVTRMTPFWFHVFYLRYMRGVPTAGQPGYGPYPTVHDDVVSRTGIHEFCKHNRLAIKEEFGQNFDLDRPGVSAFFERAFVKVMNILSLGRLVGTHNGLTFVLQKAT